MITRAELTEIGRTIKPHGINGEIATVINREIDFNGLQCVVMDIDGIFVPFFIDTVRRRGSESVLVMIDGISDEKAAKELCGKAVYALKCDLDAMAETDSTVDEEDDEGGFYAEDLIGYAITADGKSIGEITDIDASTDNLLFIVKSRDDETIYIPVAEEFIIGADHDCHILEMSLPHGLLEL